MDHLKRKDLKTDKFAQEVGHTVQFLSTHKIYGVIALVVVLAGAGIWMYLDRQAATRSQALGDALQLADAPVSTTPQPPSPTFATQEEKDKAVIEAYTKVAATYHGTTEGAIAQLYVAAMKVDKGEIDEAIRLYRDVADSAPTEHRRVAQLALGELLSGQKQNEEAERVLKALADEDSSALVSQESAKLALAKVIAARDPAEARKMLEALRDGSRTVISSAAITAMAALPAETKAEPAKAADPAPPAKTN